MDIPSQTHNAEKTPDTSNTVQDFDCNITDASPNLNGQPAKTLNPEMLTLIDILARQAAREICCHKEGDHA